MFRSTQWTCAGAALCLGWSTTVRAQVASQRDVLVAQASANSSSKTYDGFVVPSGLVEVGGALVFITAAQGPSGAELGFTDLALARLQVRRALAPEVEILATSSVLAKQPGDMSEVVWQSGSLVSTVGLGKTTGISTGVASGLLLEGAGQWWAFSPAFSYRAKLEGHPLHFSLTLGNVFTSLDFEAPGLSGFWMDELATGGEVQIGENEGGAWVGVDYSIPLAHGKAAADDPVALDPPVRLSFEVGAVWRPRRSPWDLFVSYRVVDRGEAEDETTMLPILDGGFDQRQLTLGIQYRFEEEAKDTDRWY